MRSFLRWAGSKRTLLTHLRSYWPGGNARYVEPFCGSACLFFHLQPSQAILGDLNEELIYAFNAVKRAPHVVLESLRRVRRGKSGYYRLRAMSPLSLSEGDRAARFVYLNRTCFNGIYRTNGKGEFNVPYGPQKSGRTIDESTILAASQSLRQALVVHGDFQRTLSHVQAGDFIYLDPPYSLSGRRVFREYIPGSFSVSDLQRLGAELRRLDRLKAKFVITYADSPEARRLLKEWNQRRVRVRRHVAGFSCHRRHAYEIIASNLPLL